MNKGDIFRWEWINYQGFGPQYHCCSCIAHFDGNILRDTYWSSGLDGKTFKREDVGTRIRVTFVANEADLERLSDHAEPKKYYEPDQIVNLNHPNSSRGNLYLRKGAERSKDVMLQSIEAMIEKQEHERDRAKRNIESLKDQLAEIDRKPLEDIYLLGLPMS